MCYDDVLWVVVMYSGVYVVVMYSVYWCVVFMSWCVMVIYLILGVNRSLFTINFECIQLRVASKKNQCYKTYT